MGHANNISRRHHYIPRFLIDNFSDSENMVWVYNKETGKIQNNKQSSKSIFFEWDRNNFNVNGSESDNIEKMYGDIDSLLAMNLENVLSSGTMTGRELTMLILLVTLTKWRIPASDESFYKQLQHIPIEQLGLKIRPVNPTDVADDAEMKEIKELDIVKEVNRILLSVQPLMRKEMLDDIHANCFIISETKFPALLGDVPIIERTNLSYETLEDFIFPLSSNCTLICKRGAEKYISNGFFYIQRDLTMFHLADKYVVCKSREHLQNTAEMYSNVVKENKTHLLEKYVFEFIK